MSTNHTPDTMTTAERQAIRKVFGLIDRLKDENSPAHFDSDSSPYSGFEWALERMSDELGDIFPEVIDEMNAEFAAECRALADRYNAVAYEPLTFVEANTTFRLGQKILHKGEVEQMLAALAR
jgi:hypothetical protein